MSSLELLSIAIIMLYVLGTVCIAVGLLARRDRLKRLSHWLTLAGFALHTVMLGLSMQGQTWQILEKAYYFRMLSWSLLLIYFFVWWRLRLEFLGLTASPVALVFYVSSFMLADVQSKLPPAMSGLFFGLHIGTLFLSFSLMTMACGAGVLFLYMDRKLKHKTRLSGFDRDLPALSAFDKVNHLAVMAGFPLFTLGMVSGFVWARIAWGKVLSWDPKEIISLVVWCMFAVLFHQRLALGWRGRKTAVMAIWIFAVCVFSLLGVNFLMTTHHSFNPQ
ncbi:cytochrome C assembly family protein [Nitratidesulfovibrio sp. 1201_IL3209]|jgi:cytochrome c-type biogenesis protein CcsB|uniref:cytochrome C assembly family protein n=1 Tax=Nitratidesulfovibrio sp. 1201_IL3209 TaxID=3084053 RepID=UPI002FD8E96E